MKRRPNGTGSVIKLSGSRRKPYEVRGPVKGYTDKGYPIFDRWDTLRLMIKVWKC